MRVYNNALIEDFIDEDSSEIYENMQFTRCTFDGCLVSQTNNPLYRSVMRNMTFNNCLLYRNCNTGCGILENITIENLRTNGLIRIQSSVFKHVTIKGNIGKIMINNLHWSFDDLVLKSFERENEEYYRKVDWALDISEAKFLEVDIRGIPAHLIKRDLRTQKIITRDKALTIDWDKVKLKNRIFAISISSFLDREDKDLILIAPKRSNKFEDLVYDLRILEEAGYLEEDF